jgi:putative transposase
LDLPESVYYHKPGNGVRGVKPSTYTYRLDGHSVDNTAVVDAIRNTLSAEFCCYCYRNFTSLLRDMTYVINHKKVYRLMDENNLLLGKV